MPMTRKQAWRRVRVRLEPGETKEDFNGRLKRPAAADSTNQNQRQPQDDLSPPRSAARRSDRSTHVVPSPERKVLDKWRLPKEGRDPSARPGVSAAKRQAAAVCVRVGSRVSFNTVVAAILIPSAKDLHAAARKELWWQETDYREFRINFIQFMRAPPAEAEDPDLVPVDIITESEPESAAAEEKKPQPEDDPKPVIVGAVLYEDPAPEVEPVQAWPVEEGPQEVPSLAATKAVTNGEMAVDRSIDPAAAVAAAAAAAATPLYTETPSPTPPPQVPIDDAALESSVVSFPPASDSSSVEAVPMPRPSGVSDCSSIGDGGDSAFSVAAPTGDGGECRGDQDMHRCVAPCLGWGSTAGEVGEQEEEDGEDNTVRGRRSSSNLEVASRSAPDQIRETPETSDSDESTSSAVEALGAVAAENGSRGRPRALSLDGWFTCGLENGIETKAYDSHDHAGRLRELVKLPPFPTVSARPPPTPETNSKTDMSEVLQRLRVTFDVSMDGKAVAGNGSGRGKGAGDDDGETKCRSEGEDEVRVSLPGGVGGCAGACHKLSVEAAAGPRSPGPLGGCGGCARETVGADFDVCVS